MSKKGKQGKQRVYKSKYVSYDGIALACGVSSSTVSAVVRGKRNDRAGIGGKGKKIDDYIESLSEEK